MTVDPFRDSGRWLIACCLGAALAIAGTGATADSEFRASRLSIEMPLDPVMPRDVVTDLVESGPDGGELLDAIADAFDVSPEAVAHAAFDIGEYNHSGWEHGFRIDFDPGYSYCRTRVFEFYYHGYGAAAMDGQSRHIDVMAYLHPHTFGHRTFFKIELEVLTVRNDRYDPRKTEGICREPRQPFYERIWGGCC